MDYARLAIALALGYALVIPARTVAFCCELWTGEEPEGFVELVCSALLRIERIVP